MSDLILGSIIHPAPGVQVIGLRLGGLFYDIGAGSDSVRLSIEYDPVLKVRHQPSAPLQMHIKEVFSPVFF